MLPSTGDLLARKYRLGSELGRGAMGIVYEARHETLDQRVAIKILRRSELHDEADAIRRFEREARIVAKLDSRHVVKVIDVDRTDDDVPYLVMELLEGRDLAAEVDARGEAPITITEAVGWMTQVCEAMAVAHDAGVVHRDLKLSNVFLTREGTVKVLDFGVAVLGPGNAERTATTSVAGTPRYMAPEQLLGEPPVPASDLWAIGVMLHRLLSGVFPYDAPTMAGQMLAMMKGCTPLDTVAPRVPRELAAVVTRALGHTLEERWGSVRELATALAPFAGGPAAPHSPASRVVTPPAPPAPAPAAPAPAPTAPTRRRSPRAAVSVALVVVASALVWRAMRTPPAASLPAPTGLAVVDDASTPVAPATSPASTPMAAAPGPTPSAAPAPERAQPARPVARPRSSLALPAASTTAPAPAPRPSTADDGFPAHL